MPSIDEIYRIAENGEVLNVGHEQFFIRRIQRIEENHRHSVYRITVIPSDAIFPDHVDEKTLEILL